MGTIMGIQFYFILQNYNNNNGHKNIVVMYQKTQKREIFRLSEFGKLKFLKMKGVNGSDIFLSVFSMVFFCVE